MIKGEELMADTKDKINCPACDKEMTKIFINDAGINIDVCLDGCGGILFDNRELEKFDDVSENADEILEALKGKTFESVPQEEVRICTICNTPMVKQGAGRGGVEIDVCNNCGAKFLDYGELEKIRESSNISEEDRKEIISKIEAYILENPVKVGGKFGEFAQQHYKPTPARQAVENLVRKIITKY